MYRHTHYCPTRRNNPSAEFIGPFCNKKQAFTTHMVPTNDLPQNCCDCQGIKASEKPRVLKLTGHWSHCDQESSAPRARLPLQFTSLQAIPCAFPRIWVHGVQFLLVGQTCARLVGPSIWENSEVKYTVAEGLQSHF